MKVKIAKGEACGEVRVPTSKSIAHRMLIAAAMSRGVSHISGICDCDDVRATVRCLRALGVEIDIDEKSGIYTVVGQDMSLATSNSVLDAGESGSTLRFLIPIAFMTGMPVTFVGSKRLMERPLGLYEDICKANGGIFLRNGCEITVVGGMRPGCYKLPGDISSQFITGILFALAMSRKESLIEVLQPFESRSYVLLTVEVLNKFGMNIEFTDENTLRVSGGPLVARDASVEGDYSSAAFIDALGLFGNKAFALGLNESSLQGDRVYKKHFVALDNGFSEIDIQDCPDLGPILFAIAAAKHGGYFTGTARLKIKESDRAEAMKAELAKLGAEIELFEDAVRVHPATLHTPRVPIQSHNDHRIVMSLAVLLTLVGGEIEGAEAVAKSYPDFFRDLKALGIEVTEYEA